MLEIERVTSRALGASQAVRSPHPAGATGFWQRRVLLTMALLLPTAFFLLHGWSSWHRLQASADDDLRQYASILSENAARTFRAHQIILNTVDRHFSGVPWDEIVISESGHRLLRELVEQTPELSSVFLLAPDGYRRLSSRVFPMPPLDGRDREHYVVLRTEDRLHISVPMIGRLNQDRFFSVAKRRASSNGTFDGLIAASVAPEYFEKFYAATLADATDVVRLMRGDGVVLAQYPHADEAAAPAAAIVARSDVAASAVPAVTSTRVQGVPSRVALQPVGDYGVHVMVARPQATLTAVWMHAMVPYALAWFFATVLLLGLTAFMAQWVRRATAEVRSMEAEAASNAKDAFIAALSHELRNPLAAIANAVQALQLQGRGEDRMVGVIGRQVRQLKGILDDLLDTARAQHGKLTLQHEPVDLNSVIDHAIADHAGGRPLRQRALHGALIVQGDSVRLRQMLDNLLDNAFKYGGQRVVVSTTVQDGWARIAVEDDGEGIDAKLLPRLFEPFVQGEQSPDRPRGGLGLGLALVSRLALLHGGRLQVASEGRGRGSRFTLELPLIAAEQAASPQADADCREAAIVDADAPSSGRLRVLLVDDDEDVRETLRMLLELQGHRVSTCVDGNSAVRLLTQRRFDVALVDLGLPDISGHDVAAAVRRGGNGAKLVAVSGYGQSQDRERALASGFDEHLVKPVSLNELCRTLAACASPSLAVAA